MWEIPFEFHLSASAAPSEDINEFQNVHNVLCFYTARTETRATKFVEAVSAPGGVAAWSGSPWCLIGENTLTALKRVCYCCFSMAAISPFMYTVAAVLSVSAPNRRCLAYHRQTHLRLSPRVASSSLYPKQARLLLFPANQLPEVAPEPRGWVRNSFLSRFHPSSPLSSKACMQIEAPVPLGAES